MKKKLLLCSLGFILAGLLAASPAGAFSFEGAGDLPNSGLDTEKTWLETLSGVPTGLTLTKIEPIDWNASFDYGEGTYIILKTGNLKLDSPIPNYEHFAFKMGSGDSFATYDDLIRAMLDDLNAAAGFIGLDEKDLAFWKDTASHFTIATPIPSAVLLLGSGILGLVGIRIRSRKRS